MNNIILVMLLWLGSGANAPLNTEYDSYCNGRFGYCIDYPAGILIPQEEAANGDGRQFKNRNGEVVLTVFGRLSLDAEGNTISLAKQYSNDLAAAQKKGNITYKKCTGNFYVISGLLKNGRIFYHKMIQKEDAFCFALLEYSKDQKGVFDPYAGVVFRSFK